ncbi:DNA-directed RNA polymerase sigma-70 factor [Bacteroidia bacterium]|nr:DNA-directed RNA polymerase sigma-70 factor [Bacteroidia bacterium]
MVKYNKKKEEQTEYELLMRLRKGDSQAFTALFHACKDKLYGFLLGIVKSEDKTDDLVQDIFLNIWQNRESLPEIDNLDAYLFTMAKNLAFDNLRRFAKETFILDELLQGCNDTEYVSPEGLFIEKELEEKIREAVNQLPPQQQKIYKLREHEGLRHEEIAQKLNLSVSTSKNTTKQAIANLRKSLIRLYPDISLFVIYFLF